MRRTILLAIAVLSAVGPTTASAQTEDTLLWVGMRGGMGFFNDIDPDPLEELATVLSSQRGTVELFQPVEFRDKEWAFPFDVRLGMRVGELMNIWAFYERLPYLLENDVEPRPGPIPLDTSTLNIPANVFGGGFDFRLGSDGWGRQVILGLGIGRFEARGDDEDVQGLANYEITASGRFWEVQAMAELAFTTELSFYPFVAFRSAKTDQTDVVLFQRPEARPDFPTAADIPDFEIDYTGVTVGLSVRFRLYPFDIIGDPDRSDDD